MIEEKPYGQDDPRDDHHHEGYDYRHSAAPVASAEDSHGSGPRPSGETEPTNVTNAWPSVDSSATRSSRPDLSTVSPTRRMLLKRSSVAAILIPNRTAGSPQVRIHVDDAVGVACVITNIPVTPDVYTALLVTRHRRTPRCNSPCTDLASRRRIRVGSPSDPMDCEVSRWADARRCRLRPRCTRGWSPVSVCQLVGDCLQRDHRGVQLGGLPSSQQRHFLRAVPSAVNALVATV